MWCGAFALTQIHETIHEDPFRNLILIPPPFFHLHSQICRVETMFLLGSVSLALFVPFLFCCQSVLLVTFFP